MSAKGAQWGVSYGLEVPLWYAPEGVKDEFSWRRSSDFSHVAREVASVRGSVGLAEISNFAKYKVTGEGAAAWLDRLLACKLPKPGRIVEERQPDQLRGLAAERRLARAHEADQREVAVHSIRSR